ncbi:MAG: AAA family ATPase [Prevotella sp.]|nr:AAA family ATPase [Prevotella sp.]MBR4651558.1 AAA family ATPase [Prevotella sp.]
MTFRDIIGQQEISERLRTLADENRLPHALMLCGPDGCGKMALAIALATYVLNSGTYKVRGISHPDLHFTFPTIKLKKWNSEYKPISDDFIENWREMLTPEGSEEVNAYFSLADWMEAMKGERQQAVITVGEANELIKRLSMKSNQGGWKVSIIWLPERMNLECANKMLKLIEEPPTQTLFILVCREPEKLLETIRSRVQRFDVKPIAYADMVGALETRQSLDPEDAERVARLAGGNWLAAIEELKYDNENHLFFDYFVNLMRKVYMRDVKDLKRWAESVAALGREEQKRLLTYFLRMIREAFMYNFHQKELTYMTEEEEKFCQKFAKFINEGNVLGFQELFQTAIRDIGQNANAKIVFFDITMKAAVLIHTT